jgi:hypothetical protein
LRPVVPAVALACALIDMARGNVDPAGWPVAEVIALLRDDAGRDCQVARLLAALRDIEDRIATQSPDPAEEETIRRPCRLSASAPVPPERLEPAIGRRLQSAMMMPLAQPTNIHHLPRKRCNGFSMI